MKDINSIPSEISNYLSFLNSNDQARDKMVTKDRIRRNIEGFGQAMNIFITYPDVFVDMITPRREDGKKTFELFFAQRITLRAMSRHRESYHTYTRGFSKSFLAFLSRYINTMLVPRHKAFVVAGTKKQAANIAKEKVQDDLWKRFPLLENEMQSFRVAGKPVKPYVSGGDYAEFRFTHGGIFDVIGSGSSIRGARRHSGIFEEVIEHDPIEINERVIPLMNKEREDCFGNINPNEPHSNKIFVTTAGFIGTYAYEKLIETVCYAVIDPDKYFVAGGSYQIPVMHGLLNPQTMREIFASPSFAEESIDREYRSIWSGSPVGAAFTSKKIQQLRKIVRAENKADNRLEKDEFYVVSADMAKDGSANTAVIIYKVTPKEYSFVYKMVNGFKIETTDYEEVSKQLKRATISYNARMLIYDANGIGAALRDWLNKEQVDKEKGGLLPALGIINPPEKSKKDVKKVNKDLTICYEIKATGEKAGHVHRAFFSKVYSGGIRFLIKPKKALEKFKEYKSFLQSSRKKQKERLLPYAIMDELEEEMKNLDVIDTGDAINPNNIRVKRRDARIQKDFFSAAEYGVYGVQQHIEIPYYNKKRKKKSKASAYILHTIGGDD